VRLEQPVKETLVVMDGMLVVVGIVVAVAVLAGLEVMLRLGHRVMVVLDKIFLLGLQQRLQVALGITLVAVAVGTTTL
jgi:hypothetical protein